MDLNKGITDQVHTGDDNIVIIDNFQSIRGGRTLDVTDFAPKVLNAGHVVIKNDIDGKYKPMPANGEAYEALPTDHSIVGILIATIPADKPFASIMVRGTVNVKAAPFGLEDNEELITAIETALGKGVIQFTHDKA